MSHTPTHVNLIFLHSFVSNNGLFVQSLGVGKEKQKEGVGEAEKEEENDKKLTKWGYC